MPWIFLRCVPAIPSTDISHPYFLLDDLPQIFLEKWAIRVLSALSLPTIIGELAKMLDESKFFGHCGIIQSPDLQTWMNFWTVNILSTVPHATSDRFRFPSIRELYLKSFLPPTLPPILTFERLCLFIRLPFPLQLNLASSTRKLPIHCTYPPCV